MEEVQTKSAIAERIDKYYVSATKDSYSKIIGIEDFIKLWEDEECPYFWHIELALEELGFKEDKARIDFNFYVNKREPIV